MAMFKTGSKVVEAMQFTDQSKNKVFNWVRCNCYADFVNGQPALRIETPKGEQTASFGDWIVNSGKGEFYPLSADEFEAEFKPAL